MGLVANQQTLPKYIKKILNFKILEKMSEMLDN